MSNSHGTFHWNELMARDIAAAKKFYADTIGWTYDGMPMPGGQTYWVAKMGDQPVAGLFDISGPDYKGVPDGWMPYLAVDDVDARTKKGGRRRRPRDEACLRRAGRRPHRDPDGARRRRRRLDHPGKLIGLVWKRQRSSGLFVAMSICCGSFILLSSGASDGTAQSRVA